MKAHKQITSFKSILELQSRNASSKHVYSETGIQFRAQAKLDQVLKNSTRSCSATQSPTDMPSGIPIRVYHSRIPMDSNLAPSSISGLLAKGTLEPRSRRVFERTIAKDIRERTKPTISL